ncbi:COG1737: Transcriptional regulators [Pseudoalteromonas luteoviolacea B = ATCC 29581]|nr:COG1737: Transcriptional regulators [Pseudoalteromonas luteoviolacea B = ATCC 29581]
MSLFIKINALKPSLSNSEAKLAQYTLNQPEMIRHQSSIELAAAAGVSQSSVVKFSQKLGYKGFPEFKFGVVDALNSAPKQELTTCSEFSANDSLMSMASKFGMKLHSVMDHTLELNNEKAIESCAKAFKGAKRLLFVAQGSSSITAKEAIFKLQKLGIPAQCETDLVAAANALSLLNKDDVLIIVSHSAQLKSFQKLAVLAKEANIKLITVTKYATNNLSQIADHALFSVQPQEPIPHGGILTSYSQSFILDLVIMTLSLHQQSTIKKAATANRYIEVLTLE